RIVIFPSPLTGSARKTSPFGAGAMNRAHCSFSATRLTENPAGVCNWVPRRREGRGQLWNAERDEEAEEKRTRVHGTTSQTRYRAEPRSLSRHAGSLDDRTRPLVDPGRRLTRPTPR